MIYEIEKILEMRFVILVQMNVDTTSDFFYFKPKPLKKLKKKVVSTDPYWYLLCISTYTDF